MKKLKLGFVGLSISMFLLLLTTNLLIHYNESRGNIVTNYNVTCNFQVKKGDYIEIQTTKEKKIFKVIKTIGNKAVVAGNERDISFIQNSIGIKKATILDLLLNKLYDWGND